MSNPIEWGAVAVETPEDWGASLVERPSKLERFKTDAKMMASQSLAGLVYRTGGSMLPPGMSPLADVLGSIGTPRNAGEYKQLLDEYESMPGAEGFAERATAVAGHVAGAFAPSPENFIPVGKGATLGKTFLKGAKVVGGTNLAVDAALQVGDVASGAQEEFSFTRLFATGGASAVMGGLFNAAPDVRFRAHRDAIKLAASPDATPEIKAEALSLAQEIEKKLDVAPEPLAPEPKGLGGIDDYLAESEAKGLRQAIDEGQIGGPDTAIVAKEMSEEAANKLSLRTQIEALDQRKAIEQLMADPVDLMPKLSPQAQRVYEQYGRVSPQILGSLAGGGAGAVIGSTQGETLEERVANAGYGFAIGLAGGYGTGRILSKSAPFNPASPPGALKGAGKPDPVVAHPKERKLMAGAIKSPESAPKVKSSLRESPERYYEPEGWNESYAGARKRIEQRGNLDDSFSEYRNIKEVTAEDQAMGLELYRRFQALGQFDKAHELMTLISQRSTSQGQAIAILRTLARSTPEGMLAFAEKQAGRKLNPAEWGAIKKLQESANDALEKARVAADKGDFVAEDAMKDLSLAQSARAYDAISKATPRSGVENATAALNLALLFNPKTQTRNIAGNTILASVQGAADFIAPTLDRAVGLFTGKRTVGGYDAIKYWRDLVQQPGKDYRTARAASGTLAEATDIMVAMARAASSGKMELAQMNGIHRSVFTNKVASALEKTLTLSMGAPDRAFLKARFFASLRSQMKAANVPAPTQKMWATAHLEAMEAIFQDENRASKMLSGFKKTLNIVGLSDKKGKRFGLGNAILPFTQVPGSILKRGMQFSPLGFVRGGYRAVRGAMKGEFNQRQFADEMAKAIVGSGLIGGAYWAAQMGLVRGGRFESTDVEATMKREGALPYSINLTAVNRMFLSGDFNTPQTAEKGDVIYTYDWAQPLALPLSMGADLKRYEDLKSIEEIKGKARPPASVLFGSVFDAALSSTQTLSDQPVLTGLSSFFRNTGGHGGNPLEGTLESLANLPAMYVAPPLLAQVRQYMDNRVHETRHDNAFLALYQRTMDRLPGVAEAHGFKVRRDELGQPIDRFPGETHNWFNVFFNPGFVRTIKGDPVNREILEIWRRTGDTGVVPNPVGKKITINGKERILTSQEIADYQQFVGLATRDLYHGLVRNEKFRKLKPEAKARIMGGITGDANAAAKIVLFGDRPKHASKGVKAFFDRRSRYKPEAK